MNPIALYIRYKVLTKEQKKCKSLSCNWTGPFEVTRVHANEKVKIKKGREDYRIHKNNAKKYFETTL